MNETIVYGDVAEVLIKHARIDQVNRMGWELPEPIERQFISMLSDYGLDVSVGMSGIKSQIDNFYIQFGSSWGEIEDLEFDDEEDKQHFFELECDWHDNMYYIKRQR